MKRWKILIIALALMVALTGLGLAEPVADPNATEGQPTNAGEGQTTDTPVNTLALPPIDGTEATATVTPTASPAPADTLPTVTPTVAAPSESTEPTDGQLPVTTEKRKPIALTVLVDCGYAFYGSDKFGTTRVAEPGDPQGEMLSFLKAIVSARESLMGEKASAGDKIMIVGYHSNLIEKTMKPVLFKDAATMIDEILKEPANERKSSILSAALKELNGTFEGKSYSDTYDCRLVILSGGVENPVSGEPNVQEIKAELDKLRDQKFSITGLLLTPELKENSGNCFISKELFAEGECQQYIGDLAVQRQSMMTDLLRAVCFPDMEVSGPYTLIPEAEGNARIIGWNGSELKEGEAGTMNWTVVGAEPLGPTPTPGPTPSPTPEPINWEELTTAIQDKVVNGLDKRNGDVTIELNEEYVSRGLSVACEPAELLSATIDGNTLTLSPQEGKDGSVELTLKAEGFSPDPITVLVTDTRLKWSWQEEEKDFLFNSDPAELSVNGYAGILCWQMNTPEGDLLAEGKADGAKEGEAGSLTWKTSERVLEIFGKEPCTVNLSCWVESANGAKNVETRTITLHGELGPMENVQIIAPYFKEQPGQTVLLPEAFTREHYEVVAEPGDVVSIFFSEEETELYLVPRRAGRATVTLREKNVDAPMETGFTVQVRSLASNAGLWLCAAGIVIGLVGLTAMVVILIGKKKGKKR